jgi:hypothetical protein
MPAKRIAQSAIVSCLIVVAAMSAACSAEFKPDASTPKDTVRTYLGYLSRGEWQQAYALLSPRLLAECRPDTTGQQTSYLVDELNRSRVLVRETTIRDNTATVRATVDAGNVDVGILGPRASSFDTTYTLVKDGAEWRLDSMGWPYVSCFGPDRKPLEPAATHQPGTATPAPTAGPTG